MNFLGKLYRQSYCQKFMYQAVQASSSSSSTSTSTSTPVPATSALDYIPANHSWCVYIHSKQQSNNKCKQQCRCKAPPHSLSLSILYCLSIIIIYYLLLLLLLLLLSITITSRLLIKYPTITIIYTQLCSMQLHGRYILYSMYMRLDTDWRQPTVSSTKLASLADVLPVLPAQPCSAWRAWCAGRLHSTARGVAVRHFE